MDIAVGLPLGMPVFRWAVAERQATDAQFDKLVQVFSGQLGGPMAGLAPLIGEMLGVERAAIEVEDDGLRAHRRFGWARRPAAKIIRSR